MRIGIYGGTFNPPHTGHFAAAREAIRTLKLDRLLLMPDATPPHKPLPEGTPDAEHRLAMTRIMADALLEPDIVEVSTLELHREGPSYTVDTLKEIHREYPGAKLYLLLGTDMFLTLHQWRGPKEIAKLAVICAFARNRGDEETVFGPQRELLERKYGAKVRIVPMPDLVEISSTSLRESLAAGGGGDFLLSAVYGYILCHGLYGTHADLKHLSDDDLRACSYSMVRQRRVPHIRGCEEEAVRLARRWGADETMARRAAILHDCTKYWTVEEHTAMCARCGVALDEMERTQEKLLHAKSGSCVARSVFGEPEEECQAIFWHTTGKAGMTTLEKILYLADYMEPTRDFDGVEQLRALVYEDLDAALLLAFEMSIEEMREMGKPMHPRTLEGRDELRGGK